MKLEKMGQLHLFFAAGLLGSIGRETDVERPRKRTGTERKTYFNITDMYLKKTESETNGFYIKTRVA